MKKFEGMLFCTDLDGTLYASDKTVSKQNMDAIEYFKSEGGLFTFITGRPSKITTDIYNIVHPNAPYGCFNGGAIYDAETDEYLWSLQVTGDVFELIDCVDKTLPEIGIQINTLREIYFNKDNNVLQRFRRVTHFGDAFRRYEDMSEPIAKIVFAHDDNEQIQALMKLLHGHPKASGFGFIRSEHSLYEILPKEASKGAALLKMAEILHIDPAKTIAAGDYNNDISMIQAAGLGFAVENAVPEVKAIADHVTASNNDHAIAAIIDGLDRGIYKL